MVHTQVYLTEEQDRGLKGLAKSSGRRQSKAIREAVDRLLAENRPKEWREALDAVQGIWADRDDVDEVYEGLRGGWERRRKRVYG